jgi:hypothetical protein
LQRKVCYNFTGEKKMTDQLNYDLQNEFNFEQSNYELQTKLKSIIFKHDYLIDLYRRMGAMDEMVERYERDRMAFVSVLEWMKGNKSLLNSYASVKEI